MPWVGRLKQCRLIGSLRSVLAINNYVILRDNETTNFLRLHAAFSLFFFWLLVIAKSRKIEESIDEVAIVRNECNRRFPTQEENTIIISLLIFRLL